jgi:hypothetical protein
MGHSSITITIDRYGHLFPGTEAEAASLLDAYLERVGAQRGRKPAVTRMVMLNRASLENRCGRFTSIEGSNPSPSASRAESPQ